MTDIQKVSDAQRHIVDAWKLIPLDEQLNLRLMADVATQVVIDLLAGTGGENNESPMDNESVGQ